MAVELCNGVKSGHKEECRREREEPMVKKRCAKTTFHLLRVLDLKTTLKATHVRKKKQFVGSQQRKNTRAIVIPRAPFTPERKKTTARSTFVLQPPRSRELPAAVSLTRKKEL